MERLELASEALAGLLGAAEVRLQPDGGTACAMAVLSMGREARERGRPLVIASPFEPVPVVSALRRLSAEGSDVRVVETGGAPLVEPGALSEALEGEDGAGLVTVAWASGVTAVVQPVEDLARIASRAGAQLFADARYACGRLELDLAASGVDAAVVDSPATGAPPGASAIVLREPRAGLLEHAPELHGSVWLPAVEGLLAALSVLTAGIAPRARMAEHLVEDVLTGLSTNRVEYGIVGNGAPRLPGAALLRLADPPPRLHAMLEEDGMVLPAPRSPERRAQLRALGLGEPDPDGFLGFATSPSSTIVDAEMLVRSVVRAYCAGEVSS